MKERFYSHGKLLISGEYAVLDGARGLAVPTRRGQWLDVTPGEGPGLHWVSRDADGSPWLEAWFEPEGLVPNLTKGPFPKDPKAGLVRILQATIALNPGFAALCQGKTVETQLEFPRPWGLGSSSTLLANLSRWAGVDPYALLEATMGGSGYDLACATAAGPVYFTRVASEAPLVTPAPFNPPFKQELLLVYRNVKQDSREGIRRYREAGGLGPKALQEITGLAETLATAQDLGSFRNAMDAHEALISNVLGMPPVQESHFPDFDGSVKSLGAWGGDFILAAGGTEATAYFSGKGFTTLFPFSDLVLI
ncbi:GYDIA family GHMP kinase [Robiginitalea sediminis]|uniref:GYDIA family GHMP kinase n=1 Tax=Robiginitalea sediminis TaxID=1982593 RepID=UPI000B4B78EB|nr:GYDIA family GHMP kinase [Robiginitalea sediminis]